MLTLHDSPSLPLLAGGMSINDRPDYMSAPRPRVVSSRVEAGARGASPLYDNMEELRTSTSSPKHRLSRDQRSFSEKRSERTTVTTREKTVRRPVKEPSASRGDRDKSRPKYNAPLDDPIAAHNVEPEGE